MMVNSIGFLAAITSVISLVPQIIKMLKTRSATDISMLMIINFLLTSILWVWYGLMITSWSVLVTNILMLVFAVIMMYLKTKYNNV